MPLLKGKAAKTAKGRGENIKRLVSEGKPVEQAVAISYRLSGEKPKKGKR